MKKLQRALISKGYIININCQEVWNEEHGKMLKIYSLKHGKETVMRSTSCIKHIKYMADCYKIIKERPEIMKMSEEEQNEIMDKECRKW